MSSAMDIDAASPPSSPTAPSAGRDPQSPPHSSHPVPILGASARFQPSIAKSTSPSAFAPPSGYPTSMFKPKTARPSSSAAVPNHAPQPARPASRFNPVINVIVAPAPLQHHSHPDIATPFDDPDPGPVASPDQPLGSPMGPPFGRTAPVQIPGASGSRGSLDGRPPLGRSLGTPTALGSHMAALSAPVAIPQSLPNVSPSFPATLFGGLSADDEHVTVWEPHTGKTVAGNAAPYRRNLASWLEGHPGWEEKADELKSSKRRSAARRARNAADAFAALCCFPVATFLANDAAKYLQALGNGDHCNEEAMTTWTNDDFVRLQEALFRLGQECHAQQCNPSELDESRWANVSAQIGGSKMQGTIVYCARHMLTRGIAKSQRELAGNAIMPVSFGAMSLSGADISGIDSPASVSSYEAAGGVLDSFGPSSLPTMQVGLGASFLERSFRAPRERRVTVWNPSNGRTISGNAAPCRRNLEAWMRQHPGWCPKEEGQLSSSRRNRNRKIQPSSMPSGADVEVEPESPHFHDALEGLLFLARSPSAGMSPSNAASQLEQQVARAEGQQGLPIASRMDTEQSAEEDGTVAKKLGMTSSVSSSSAEDGSDAISYEEEEEASKMEL